MLNETVNKRYYCQFPLWLLALLAFGLSLVSIPALAEDKASEAPADDQVFSKTELLNAGHGFFGQVSGNIAGAFETITGQFGYPKAYIIGEEAAAALVGGVSYGEGLMYTKAMPEQPLQIYWQGPSVGFDAGVNGDRTMVLVYGYDSPDEVLRRFGGVSGSAYLVGGLSVTALASDHVFVVVVKSGVGVRLGANVGYIKFTDKPTWNPF